MCKGKGLRSTANARPCIVQGKRLCWVEGRVTTMKRGSKHQERCEIKKEKFSMCKKSTREKAVKGKSRSKGMS